MVTGKGFGIVLCTAVIGFHAVAHVAHGDVEFARRRIVGDAFFLVQLDRRPLQCRIATGFQEGGRFFLTGLEFQAFVVGTTHQLFVTVADTGITRRAGIDPVADGRQYRVENVVEADLATTGTPLVDHGFHFVVRGLAQFDPADGEAAAIVGGLLRQACGVQRSGGEITGLIGNVFEQTDHRAVDGNVSGLAIRHNVGQFVGRPAHREMLDHLDVAGKRRGPHVCAGHGGFRDVAVHVGIHLADIAAKIVGHRTVVGRIALHAADAITAVDLAALALDAGFGVDHARIRFVFFRTQVALPRRARTGTMYPASGQSRKINWLGAYCGQLASGRILIEFGEVERTGTAFKLRHHEHLAVHIEQGRMVVIVGNTR